MISIFTAQGWTTIPADWLHDDPPDCCSVTFAVTEDPAAVARLDSLLCRLLLGAVAS